MKKFRKIIILKLWRLKRVWTKTSVEKTVKLQPWPMSFTSSTDLNWLLPSRLSFRFCQMIKSSWNYHVILIKHKPFFAVFTAFFNSALFDFRSFWSLKKEIPTLKIYTMITVSRPQRERFKAFVTRSSLEIACVKLYARQNEAHAVHCACYITSKRPSRTQVRWSPISLW